MRHRYTLIFLLAALILGPYQEANLASTDPIILEITDCGWGLAYPPGCRLYFRMYGSGRLEYEAEPQYEPKLKKLVWKTKVAYLKNEDVVEITRLISDKGYLEGKDDYPPLLDFVDAALELRIKSEYGGLRKGTEVRNYMPRHKRAETYYPASLMLLIAKVKELRPKEADE